MDHKLFYDTMESQAVIIPIFGMGQKFSTALGAISGKSLILIEPSSVTISTKASFSCTSVDNCGNSRAFKSTDSEVDMLSAELLDEGSVVLEPVQAANNKRLAAAVSVNRIFHSFIPSSFLNDNHNKKRHRRKRRFCGMRKKQTERCRPLFRCLL